MSDRETGIMCGAVGLCVTERGQKVRSGRAVCVREAERTCGAVGLCVKERRRECAER